MLRPAGEDNVRPVSVSPPRTLGAGGAILRGTLRATVAGVPCRPVNTAGAGDTLTGTLLARLALGGFHPSAVAAGLPEAIEAAARACERWSAVD